MQWPTMEDYNEVICPVILIRGEMDRIATQSEAALVAQYLPNIHGRRWPHSTHASPAKYPSFRSFGAGTHHSEGSPPMSPNPDCDSLLITTLKSTAHNLQVTDPIPVTAIISTFLIRNFIALDPTPSLLAANPPEQKWNMKNLDKWVAVEPFSKPIGTSRIIGMKCLKGDDAVHSPKAFLKKEPRVGLVIDLSHQLPSYEPTQLGNGKYIKLGTQSKVVPTEDDVEARRLVRSLMIPLTHIRNFWRLLITSWSHVPKSTSRFIATMASIGQVSLLCHTLSKNSAILLIKH